MSINNISGISFSIGFCDDEEQKRIALKLREYGIKPTGNKATDRATLRRIEIEKAKQESTVTNKFVTVSKQEQEKIQEIKKRKRKELNPELNKDEFQGSEALGQQIYLAIKMNNSDDLPFFKDKKRCKDNK